VAEIVVAPDVEAVVVAGLAAGLPGVTVATNVPNSRPVKLVRVRRRGGPRRDVVLETPLLLVDCWAAEEVVASDLARLAAGVFASLQGQTVAGSHITHAEILGGPSNDPDPDSASPRYSFTGQLTTFAEVV
jgi:hypothetical protein